MANFGKREERPLDRRWLKRKRIGTPAFAISEDGTRSVLIQDISMTGARLLGRDFPSRGAEVELKVGDRSLCGQIAWAADGRCGVSLNFGQR